MDEYAQTINTLEEAGCAVGVAFRLRHLKAVFNHALQFNEFGKAVTSLQAESPVMKGIIDVEMPLESLEEFSLTLVQTQFEVMLKSLTIPDIKNGGASKVRMASFARALKDSSFMGHDSHGLMREQFAHSLVLLLPGDFDIQRVTAAVEAVEQLDADEELVILKSFCQIDKGKLVLDAARSSVDSRDHEAAGAAALQSSQSAIDLCAGGVDRSIEEFLQCLANACVKLQGIASIKKLTGQQKGKLAQHRTFIADVFVQRVGQELASAVIVLLQNFSQKGLASFIASCSILQELDAQVDVPEVIAWAAKLNKSCADFRSCSTELLRLRAEDQPRPKGCMRSPHRIVFFL